MSKAKIPKLAQLLINLIWASSPKNWILKTTYFKSTVFISISIMGDNNKCVRKVRRNICLDTIKSREEDLWGLASDLTDEMKTEVKKR